MPQSAYLQGSNSAAPAMVPIDVLDAAVLQQIVVNFGIVGGHGALPQNFPTFQVLSVAKGGTVTVVASGAVSAGSVAAYEATTAITIVPTPLPTIDRQNYAYWLRIYDESGTNSLNGNRYHSVVATSRASAFRPA